ncbi:MAG: matrixin family metalloprotease [Pirellula sp.]
MSGESLTQRIQNLRGKRLDAPEAVGLWQELHASLSDDSTTLTADQATESTERWPRQQRDAAPGSLGEWVQVNRTLRGAPAEAIARDHLDQRDLDALEQPRCGLWRVARDLVPAEIEQRLGRREWFGAKEKGWDRTKLHLAIHSNSHPPPDVPIQQYHQAVDRAISSWNRAEVGISIERVERIADIEILVQWSTPALDAHRLLSQAVLAHADYPPPNMHLVTAPPLPICLNKATFWAPEDAGGAVIASRYDIESFILHELGHCLGLFHRSEGSVMYEVVKKGRHRTLDPGSILAARELYASGSDRIA